MDTRQNGTGLLMAALGFAAEKHRNQRRKDNDATPYINHPITLAVLLNQEGGIDDVIVLCAALLHDTLEDTDATEEDLRERFGCEVAGLVLEVTDDQALPRAGKKRLQIARAPALSDKAKLVKLADKISNLRDIAAIPPAGWTAERKREYCEFAKSVVDGLRGIHPVLEAKFDIAYARVVGNAG